MPGQYSFEATAATFQRDVIEKSHAVPVLVDFWAPWCSPCGMLGPVLEKVVGEYGGGVILAKVNVESDPEPAARYGVSSIPAVKLFVNGEVAAEFTGALPETQVREFLREAVLSDTDELVTQAQELKERGLLTEAEALAKNVLQASPEHQGAMEIVATAAMVAGRVDEALDWVNRMETPSKDMQFLVEGADFWRMCAGAAAEAGVPEAPAEDQAGKMKHAACLASSGEFVPALDLLLEVVAADRSFREGLARKAAVSLFVVMGLNSPLVREYQSKLAQLLF